MEVRTSRLLPSAPSWEEALRLQAPPEKLWFKGRLVAENSVSSELYRAPRIGNSTDFGPRLTS